MFAENVCWVHSAFFQRRFFLKILLSEVIGERCPPLGSLQKQSCLIRARFECVKLERAYCVSKLNQPRSCSFTNQTLAQLELWKERDSGKYKTDQVYLLPKNLDEKVARLHLPALGAELTVLTKEQADYIDVPVGGPYKPDTYRY